MLTPILQMRRVRPRQVRELAEVRQRVISREGMKGRLQVSRLLLPTPPCRFSHTCVLPAPTQTCPFVYFLMCACTLLCVGFRGTPHLRALSWSLKPPSALLLALPQSLCGDFGPFIDPLLTPD